MICCIAITVALTIYLADFYQQLQGFWGLLIDFSPITMVIGLILYLLSAIAIVQAVKIKFLNHRKEEKA